MKNTITTILIAAAVVAPAIAGAQHAVPRPGRDAKRMLMAGSGRAIHRPAYAAKTTATDARLISLAELEYSGSAFDITDSVALTYTGTNGGLYDERWQYWDWEYSQGLMYPYSGGAYGPAEMKFSQTFDASGNIATQLYQEWNSATSTWVNSSRSTRTYDASNNMLTELSEDWNTTTSAWENSLRMTYTYTPGNKVDSFTQENWNTTTSAWENTARTYNTWDGSGRISLELVKFWQASTSTWRDGFRTTFTYDGSGNRTTELREVWGTTWTNYDKTENSNFAGLHQPQTITYMDWSASASAFVNSSRDNYTFNSYNKPDYLLSENWSSATSAWEPSYASRYHYETFTTGVEKVASHGGNLSIYPVPASNTLTIDANWTATQPFTATVADMSGRIYTSWSVAGKKDYHETISLSELPTGSYMLTLQGAQGRLTKQFTVTK